MDGSEYSTEDQRVHYHIGFSRAQLPEPPVAVLLSGDPYRTDSIATQHLSSPTQLSAERGLHSWFGYSQSGQAVLASTSGMGAPSLSIVVNELLQIGVEKIIRIGTTGSIAPAVKLGSLVITQACLCLHGAADDIAPSQYPSSADPELTLALLKAAKSLGHDHHLGVTASLDTFYEGQARSDSLPNGLQPHLQGRLEEFARLRILNMEMEAGTLLKMGLVYGFKAACITAVVADRNQSELPDPNAKEVAVKAAIETALTTVDGLIGSS